MYCSAYDSRSEAYILNIFRKYYFLKTKGGKSMDSCGEECAAGVPESLGVHMARRALRTAVTCASDHGTTCAI